MISADTSAWIDFFKGVSNQKSERLSECLRDGSLLMISPVLMELLSFQGISPSDQELLRCVPRVDLRDGYWERAADTRKHLLKKGLKARSMDCLIAQCCMDEELPLIANDQDFRQFLQAGLILL